MSLASFDAQLPKKEVGRTVTCSLEPYARGEMTFRDWNMGDQFPDAQADSVIDEYDPDMPYIARQQVRLLGKNYVPAADEQPGFNAVATFAQWSVECPQVILLLIGQYNRAFPIEGATEAKNDSRTRSAESSSSASVVSTDTPPK